MFSQWDEDGIIKAVLIAIPPASLRKVFVEFGVSSYVESSTRFLLVNDNWSVWSSVAARLKAECRFISATTSQS